MCWSANTAARKKSLLGSSSGTSASGDVEKGGLTIRFQMRRSRALKLWSFVFTTEIPFAFDMKGIPQKQIVDSVREPAFQFFADRQMRFGHSRSDGVDVLQEIDPPRDFGGDTKAVTDPLEVGEHVFRADGVTGTLAGLNRRGVLEEIAAKLTVVR